MTEELFYRGVRVSQRFVRAELGLDGLGRAIALLGLVKEMWMEGGTLTSSRAALLAS